MRQLFGDNKPKIKFEGLGIVDVPFFAKRILIQSPSIFQNEQILPLIHNSILQGKNRHPGL